MVRAVVFARDDFDFPAMLFDNSLGDGQPQPNSNIPRGVEWVESVGGSFFREALTPVGNFNLHPRFARYILFAVRSHRDLGVYLACLQCIQHDFRERVFQP